MLKMLVIGQLLQIDPKIHENIKNLKHTKTELGFDYELKFIDPTIKPFMSSLLKRDITIVKKESGVFRRPHNSLIHFDNFNSLDEWSLYIAYEPTTINLHKHKSGAESALNNIGLNYKYLPDWDYTSNIIIQPGEAILIKPWYFRSLQDGLVNYYKVIAS